MFCFAAPAFGQTTLNLSVTGQDLVAPDEINVSLLAQGSAYNLAAAQNQVNQAMASGLKMAKALAGVRATTTGYAVSEDMPDRTGGAVKYEAQEELDLVMAAPGGEPAAALAQLLGALQDKGFSLQNFDGGLSDAAQRAAEQSAIGDAMAQILAQAAAVGGRLGEKVARVTAVNLNMGYSGPAPVAMAAAPMAMARNFVAPSAAPSRVQVTASVTATVALAASE